MCKAMMTTTMALQSQELPLEESTVLMPLVSPIVPIIFQRLLGLEATAISTRHPISTANLMSSTTVGDNNGVADQEMIAPFKQFLQQL